MDDTEVVLVGGESDLISHPHATPELFVDLPLQRRSWGLTGLDLASGELPHARQRAVGSALDAQDLAPEDDDGADHLQYPLHNLILRHLEFSCAGCDVLFTLAQGVMTMSAGESAYDVARRQREEAERLQRSAEMWERGAEGEVAVARVLDALPDGWVTLHDLAWPGRQRANIDHVVIGPGGVFVVDAKNWSGRVEVRDQVLLQNGRQRETAVSSVTSAAIAVQEIVAPVPCVGVLCFVRDEPLVASTWNVTVCSTENLAATLVERAHMLSADDVRRCVEAVRIGTTPRTATAPTRSIKARPRKRSRVRRPVVAMVGGLVLLAAMMSGGYQKAADWAGQRLVEVVVPEAPVDPSPTLPAKDQNQKKQRNQKKQGQQGG